MLAPALHVLHRGGGGPGGHGPRPKGLRKMKQQPRLQHFTSLKNEIFSGGANLLSTFGPLQYERQEPTVMSCVIGLYYMASRKYCKTVQYRSVQYFHILHSHVRALFATKTWGGHRRNPMCRHAWNQVSPWFSKGSGGSLVQILGFYHFHLRFGTK